MPPSTTPKAKDPVDLAPEFVPHSTLEVAPNRVPESSQPQDHTIPADGKYDRGKRICGLRATTFWLALALAIALVLAVVGSAVGGALASRHSSQKTSNNSSPSSTTTKAPSSTSHPSSTSSTSTPTPSAVPSNECPGSNNTDFTAPLTSSVFRITCGIDWPVGFAATDGNGTVQDLIGIYSDSIEKCIDGCASYNHNQGGTPCTAVSYTADPTKYWVADQHANCFLKSKPGGAYTLVDSIAVAQLVS